jgi:hypothetical protein
MNVENRVYPDAEQIAVLQRGGGPRVEQLWDEIALAEYPKP